MGSVLPLHLVPADVAVHVRKWSKTVNKQSIIREAREFAQQEPLPASPIGLFIPFSGAFEERHGAEARKEMRRNFRDDATFAMAEELWRRLVEDLRAPAQSAVEASALTPGAGAHRRFEDVLTNMVYSQIIRDVDPALVISTGFAPDVLDGAGNPMPFSLVYSRLRYGAYADLEQRFRDLKDTPSSREALYTVVNKWLGRYDDELTQKQQATADLVQKRIAEIAAIRQRPAVKAQSDSRAPRKKIGAVQAETYKYPALFELAQILRNQEGSILERKVKVIAPMRFKSYFSTLATIASNLGIEREALLNHVKRGDIEVLSTEAGYGRDEGLHGQRDAQIIEYAVHPGVESLQKASAHPIKKGDIVRYNKQSVHSHSRRGWRGTVQRVDGDMLYVDWQTTDGDLRYRNEPTSEDDIARVT